MSSMSQIKKDFLEAMKESGKEKTKPYDTSATVRRIEGKTAWVHIDGGVDETPVQLTIDAKAGDTVKVRVSGGQAWIMGNGTAPPTDDTVAKRVEAKATIIERVVNAVKTVAENAYRIAGNTDQFFWVTESGTDTGAHITEIPREDFLADPDNGGGNLLARSNGIAVRNGMQELATFSANGMTVTAYDDRGNSKEIAHLGYGQGSSETGTSDAPYYTLGRRDSAGTVGNYSVAVGYKVRANGYVSYAEGCECQSHATYSHTEGAYSYAYGYCSHAEGYNTLTYGENAHTQNLGTQANYDNQTAIGKYNDNDQNNAFEIGNGSRNNPSNAFAVDWDGNVKCANVPTMTECGAITNVSNVASHDYADYQVTFTKTFSSAPIVVVGMMSSSTGYGVGSVSVSAHSITTTGFTARIFNNDTSARSPYIHWIAMEQ